MSRTAAILVSTIVGAAVLAGCGGQSDYCKAVEKDEASLNTFGQTRTDAAYKNYAKILENIATVAPDPISKEWSKLAEATRGVVAAQKAAGVALEEVTPAKVKDMKPEKKALLNTAYETFNGTSAQRAAVVKNVKQECKITLK